MGNYIDVFYTVLVTGKYKKIQNKSKPPKVFA